MIEYGTTETLEIYNQQILQYIKMCVYVTVTFKIIYHYLQMVQILMRRLVMNRLVRIYNVCIPL